jgi:hypothetical protein
LSASTFTFFNLGGGGASYGTATGGSSSSITVGADNYTLLTFTSDDNLVVSTAGLFDVLLAVQVHQVRSIQVAVINMRQVVVAVAV